LPAPVPSEGHEVAMLADRPDLLAGMNEVARATYPEVGTFQAKHAERLHDWQLYQLGSLETVVAWGRSPLAGQTYGTELGFEPRGETIAFRGPLQ
jgi:hypothetical protein